MLACSVAIAGAGCNRSPKQDQPTGAERKGQATQPTKPLVWGGPKNIAMLPIVAEQQGFFRELGLQTAPKYLQTGKIAMDAVVSGDLDVGVIVDTNIAFVGFQKGADIQVIASTMEKYDDAIIARKDQGVTKPKDLEGKQLAILTGTTSHRFADLFIEFYNLDKSKIEFVNLSPPGIQAAVLSGQVTAGSVWQPFRYNIVQKLGDQVVQFNDRAIYKAYSLLAVRSPRMETRAADLQAFFKALVKAERFIAEHKQEAIKLLSAELDIDESALGAVWDEYAIELKLDNSLLETLQNEGQWIKREQKGFEAKPIPDYAQMVSSDLLRSVDLKRVQLQ